jgi:hypothetical protein
MFKIPSSDPKFQSLCVPKLNNGIFSEDLAAEDSMHKKVSAFNVSLNPNVTHGKTMVAHGAVGEVTHTQFSLFIRRVY